MTPYINNAIWGLKCLDYFWDTTYRGIQVKDNHITQNMFVRFQDFISSSHKQGSCFTPAGGGTLLVIKCKTGRQISKISFYPNEEEVLFIREPLF